jgi:hypothetical protein
MHHAIADYLRQDKALAVASVAHPKFSEDYIKELYDNPMFTKPAGFYPGKAPHGFTPYRGKTRID